MLVVVSSSYPTSESDYRGHFVARFARGLLPLGPVHIVTPLLAGSLRRERWDGAEHPLSISRVGAARRGGGQGPFGRLFGEDGILANIKHRPWQALQLAPACRAIAQRLHKLPTPEVITAHWLLPFGLVAAQVGRERGIPVRVVCHSGGVRVFCQMPRPVRHRLARALFQGNLALSFATPMLRDVFVQSLPPTHRGIAVSRSRILPMGVDVGRFAEVSPARSGPLVYLGRLTRLKGLHLLLDALAQSTTRARLLVVGWGPEGNNLRRQARRLRLDVVWLGERARADVPHCLKGASGLVLPSQITRFGRREGFPNAPLEGLAAGLPLMLTETWDIPAAVKAAPGVICVASDRAGLTRGLQSLATPRTDIWSAASIDARRRVAARFSWEATHERSRRFITEP